MEYSMEDDNAKLIFGWRVERDALLAYLTAKADPPLAPNHEDEMGLDERFAEMRTLLCLDHRIEIVRSWPSSDPGNEGYKYHVNLKGTNGNPVVALNLGGDAVFQATKLVAEIRSYAGEKPKRGRKKPKLERLEDVGNPRFYAVPDIS